MYNELNALVCNRTWTIVPAHASQHVIGYKGVFRMKQNLDGSIAHYKACFVA